MTDWPASRANGGSLVFVGMVRLRGTTTCWISTPWRERACRAELDPDTVEAATEGVGLLLRPTLCITDSPPEESDSAPLCLQAGLVVLAVRGEGWGVGLREIC